MGETVEKGCLSLSLWNMLRSRVYLRGSHRSPVFLGRLSIGDSEFVLELLQLGTEGRNSTATLGPISPEVQKSLSGEVRVKG